MKLSLLALEIFVGALDRHPRFEIVAVAHGPLLGGLRLRFHGILINVDERARLLINYGEGYFRSAAFSMVRQAGQRLHVGPVFDIKVANLPLVGPAEKPSLLDLCKRLGLPRELLAGYFVHDFPCLSAPDYPCARPLVAVDEHVEIRREEAP